MQKLDNDDLKEKSPTYRRRPKGPDCEGPADTWGKKMVARMKESKLVKAVRKDPAFWIFSMFFGLVALTAVLVLGSFLLAQFRDPILVSPPCDQRCRHLGAAEYRLETRNIVLSRAREIESLCACQFEDGKQLNLVPGSWESVEQGD